MTILIIAAHPDDEILGCGGLIASKSSNEDFFTLILSQGIASRNLSEKEKQTQLEEIKSAGIKANNHIGVREVFFEDFPDNQFDTVPLLNIIKTIEKYLKKIRPDAIYTHHYGDLNVDHQITFRAVLTASRPVGEFIPKSILTFETLSSTEWNYQNPSNIFTPNVFIDISHVIDKKLEAMNFYKSELREYPHPRSIQGIKIHSQKRGIEVGLKFAEAFCLIREIKE